MNKKLGINRPGKYKLPNMCCEPVGDVYNMVAVFSGQLHSTAIGVIEISNSYYQNTYQLLQYRLGSTTTSIHGLWEIH